MDGLLWVLLSALCVLGAVLSGIAGLVILSSGFLSLVKGRHPENHAHCPFCGYETNLPAHLRCPECGKSATPEQWAHWRKKNLRALKHARQRLTRAIVLMGVAAILAVIGIAAFMFVRWD